MASKKKSRAGLPKRIAGIKVPKELRKSSDWLLMLAQTPVVRQIIAAGLVAAAAAITGSASDKDAAGRKSKKAPRKIGKLASESAGKVGDMSQAVGAAVAAAMDKWLGGSLHWQPAGGPDDEGVESDGEGRAH